MTTYHDLLRERFGEATTGSTPDERFVEATRAVLGRRTMRRYTDKPVDDALLELLLACAQSAPAKSDLQQYSIIHVANQESRTVIGDLLPAMPWVASAPVFLVFCGDIRRNRRISELRGYTHANDNVDTFMNAAVDAALALGFFMSAAEAAGLGCCPISMVRNHLDTIAPLLELPEGVFPIAGLTLGWPADSSRTSLRLPSRLVVHQDRYDDSTLAVDVDGYDDKRLDRQPIPPAKQRHVDRYGALDNARWSENIARQLSLPERAEFRAWLRKQGINLEQ